MPNWCAPQVSTGVNVSVMVLQGRKSSPQKSRPPESGHRRHGVWIAIEYSYKLGQKKNLNSCAYQAGFRRSGHICYHTAAFPRKRVVNKAPVTMFSRVLYYIVNFEIIVLDK